MVRPDEDMLQGSEARLWALIASRLAPGAQVEEIDRRIWQLFGEEWAVMFTDLAGFSRQTERFGIIHFLQTIYEKRRLLLPIIADAGGVFVKAEADSFLILFRQADAALACADAMQRACTAFNEGRPEEDQMLLCVGLGFGKILRVGEHEVWGSEVNAASKLGEDLARAGEVLVTEGVRANCGAAQGVSFVEFTERVPGSAKNYRAIWSR